METNILLAIADDQGWPHTSAYGCSIVETPGFRRVADEGVLFHNAYCPAPQCSPSRAALLTGRNIWQIEEAGTHASFFPPKFAVYPELLERAGYHVGYTGKPWGPGSWEGRARNPSGKEYNRVTSPPPTSGISSTDYAGNFLDFLQDRPDGRPFCFWFGCREPHRVYERGSGEKSGKRLDDVEVPPYLPDVPEVRSDFLDYALEIDWFDTHLVRMIRHLESIGELDNTLIIVTSDNGMPFPRAKANNYEAGVHVPMAIRWGDAVPGGRELTDFVSFIDLAPTFLEAAGLDPHPEMTGRSLVSLLKSEGSGRAEADRDHVVTGRERHTHARPDNVGYPVRAIHTDEFVYICNMKADRWPVGDPEYGFLDVDNSPTKSLLVERWKDFPELYDLAFGLRPDEELYDTRTDRWCVRNMAADPRYQEVKKRLRRRLEGILSREGDPRVTGSGDIFDAYPRVTVTRPFIPGFSAQGEYNPEFLKRARGQ